MEAGVGASTGAAGASPAGVVFLAAVVSLAAAEAGEAGNAGIMGSRTECCIHESRRRSLGDPLLLCCERHRVERSVDVGQRCSHCRRLGRALLCGLCDKR